MQKLGTILGNIDLTRDTHVSREFQRFGLYIAEQLNDPAHKSLYIKMAKVYPRQLLEEALSFARDANARNRAAVFMWKLKEIRKLKVDEPKK